MTADARRKPGIHVKLCPAEPRTTAANSIRPRSLTRRVIQCRLPANFWAGAEEVVTQLRHDFSGTHQAKKLVAGSRSDLLVPFVVMLSRYYHALRLCSIIFRLQEIIAKYRTATASLQRRDTLASMNHDNLVKPH
ncbi:hypothetical protein ACLOJK_032433 [Asimina triloba]